MDEQRAKGPDRQLIGQALILVFRNAYIFAPLTFLFLLLFAGAEIAPSYLIHGGQNPDFLTKANTQDFILFDAIGNSLSTLAMLAWAGIYGVAFAILQQSPNPAGGFSAAWRRFVPVVVLGLATDVVSILIDLGLRAFHLIDPFASLMLYSVLTVPLMLNLAAIVGLRLGVVESVKYSLRRFEEDPWAYFRFWMNCAFLVVLGAIAFVVGLLIALPTFAMAMAMLVNSEPAAPATE